MDAFKRKAIWAAASAFVLMGAAGDLPSAAATASPTPAAPPSGIGSANVFGIAVSPAYLDTGLVVATAQPLGVRCSSSCLQLWVSHDGGASWQQSPATGWNQGRPVIAVSASGHEVLFAGAGSDLRRSDDDGSTWTVVPGAPGAAFPAVSPHFATDSTVAGAMGGQDFLLRGSVVEHATGSSGSIIDMAFSYVPSYPSAGAHAPVLLSGMDSSSKLPVVQQCSATFVCSGSATLPGATTFSAPALLYPSNDFADDGVVFAQSGRGIYRSTDGGLSFTLIPMGDPTASSTATPSFALAPGYRQNGAVRTAYASVLQIYMPAQPGAPKKPSSGGIYRTTDGGQTWAPVGSPSPLDGGSMAVATAPDGRVFAGYIGSSYGGAGLLCSSDGQTWRASCPSVGHYWRDHSGQRPSAPSQASAGCNAGGCNAGHNGAASPVPSTGTAVTATGSRSENSQRISAALPRRGEPIPMPTAAAVAAIGLVVAMAAFKLRRRRRSSRAP